MTTCTIEHEACGDGYDWHVMRDGEAWDSFRTQPEAQAEADRLDRQEACEELRESIGEALEECEDPATLAVALALLRR